MNTKKILFYSAAGVFLLAGGYLLYVKVVKPIIDKRKAKKDAANLPAEIPATTGGTTSGGKSDADLRESALKDGKHIYVKNGRYYTTGKDAEGSFRIQPNIEILKPKGSIQNLQVFLNGKGEKLKEDGIWGQNTANAMVKWVKSVGTGGVGWSINDNQKTVSYYQYNY